MKLKSHVPGRSFFPGVLRRRSASLRQDSESKIASQRFATKYSPQQWQRQRQRKSLTFMSHIIFSRRICDKAGKPDRCFQFTLKYSGGSRNG